MSKRKDLIAEIFRNTASLSRGVIAAREEAFSELDLSDTQIEVLFQVYADEKLTMKQLADRLMLTNGAITQVVDALITRKLVSRAQDKNDRRSWSIKLTTTAERKFEKINARQFTQMGSVFADFSETDLAEFSGYLKKLKVNLYNHFHEK